MECNGIGKRITALREARDLTQAELAGALFVKRETVNQWENETRDLKTDYTVKLANYFNVTCDYILRGVKAENVETNNKTGLSDKAIDKLPTNFTQKIPFSQKTKIGRMEGFKHNQVPLTAYLNMIIEHEKYLHLLVELRNTITICNKDENIKPIEYMFSAFERSEKIQEHIRVLKNLIGSEIVVLAEGSVKKHYLDSTVDIFREIVEDIVKNNTEEEGAPNA